MLELTREDICSFVEESLANKQYNKELCFALSDKTVQRVQEKLYFNLQEYVGVISSHSVRHIGKGHPDDIGYICEILEILQDFSYVIKPPPRRDHKTGSAIVSIEFYKRYDSKTVKLVKLKIHRKKRLELKTLFVKDE